MKLRTLKTALLVGTMITTAEFSHAATDLTAQDISGNSNAGFIIGTGASLTASAAVSNYTGTIVAEGGANEATATEGVVYLDTTYAVTFNGGIGSSATNNVVLSIMNTGDVTLTSNSILYPSTSGNYESLQLRGANTTYISTAATFPVSSGIYPNIGVYSGSTIDFQSNSLTLAAPIYVAAGNTLTINVDIGSVVSLSGVISGSGNIIMTGDGTLKFTNTANTLSGTMTLSSSSAGTLYLSPLVLVDGQSYSSNVAIPAGIYQPINVTSGTATVSGIISGAGSIQKTGAGILQLSGSNTFTGSITVGDGSNAAGTLVALNATAFGSATATSNLTVAAAANSTLMFGTVAVPLAAFSTTRPVVLSDTTHSTGFSVPSSTSVININGIISGGNSSYNVAKSGAGRLNFGAANTYSSNTTIAAGSLGLGVATSASSGSITMSNNTSLYLPTGSKTVTNAIVLGGVSTIQSVALTDSTILSGIISGNNAVMLKAGAGNITLTGSNTYTGGTYLNAGSITAGVASPLSSGDLTVTGASNLIVPSTYTLGAIPIILNAPLTVNVSAGANATFGGEISSNAAANTITKTGAGDLTLSETNSQISNTIVLAGRLINGTASILGTGNAVFSSGATARLDASAHTITNNGVAAATFVLSQ